MDLLCYFRQDERVELDRVFTATLENNSALVFQTGISLDLAKTQAGKNNLKTLTIAIGALYSDQSAASLRSRKTTKLQSSFIKGASGLFAQHTCYSRRAIVLTNPPPNTYSTRLRSNYRDIEEPILKGVGCKVHTIRIDYAYPTVPSAELFVYQTQPEDTSFKQFTFLNTILAKAAVRNLLNQKSTRRKGTGCVAAAMLSTSVQGRDIAILESRTLASSVTNEQQQVSP